MARRWWQFGLPEKWPPNDVEEWLVVRYGAEAERISSIQDVFWDLKQSGDDCFEFMEEFSRLFGVDLAAYDWTKYQYDEVEEMGFSLLYRALFSVFRVRRPPANRPIYPISVGHLLDVARAKRWFDPNPMPAPRAHRDRK